MKSAAAGVQRDGEVRIVLDRSVNTLTCFLG